MSIPGKLYSFGRALALFIRGYSNFIRTGKTSSSAYGAMRNLFVMSRGKTNDIVSLLIKSTTKKYRNLKNAGILESLTKDQWNEALNSVRTNGCYIFDLTLSQSQIDSIFSFAETETTPYLDLSLQPAAFSTEKIKFDRVNPVSPRYQFTGETTMQNQAIQSLVFDKSLMKFAQEYLNSRPILDLIAFWWSIPFNGKGLSESAQMYHFDLDRIKFLKFFFYITDVDTDTGPHCYARGSHLSLPKKLQRDGRFTDEEIESVYSPQDVIEICGKKGTLMAIDTRGFHKGKELTKDCRLLFQIQFSNSLFGQSYPSIKVNIESEKDLATFFEYPFTYQQLFTR